MVNNIRTFSQRFQGRNTEKFSKEVLQKFETPRKIIWICLNVPESTYNNWHYGHSAFPPDLIPELYLCLYPKDQDLLLEFLLDRMGLMAVHKPKGKTSVDDVHKHQYKQLSLLSKQADEINKALTDRIIHTWEYLPIHRILSKEIQKAADLDESIKSMVRI